MKIGFDKDLYMQKQTMYILERIRKYDKLYLEFGGKLFDDLHAARVLPGFDCNAKIKLLQQLKDKSELIFCISAGDLARNKVRADYNITYDNEVLRLIDNISAMGISINSVVITKFEEQPAATVFKRKLENRGVKVYIHRLTKGYPNDIETIVSDEGYGANPYIETTRPLVVVNAPGPGSGKLATCLSQLFHEYKRGVKAGYAKFETFPIWNLPLAHPVNVAYEAATADIKDVNMIDHFHMQAYERVAVNYNRDLEVFPVVQAILSKISGGSVIYQSPTDMGVNMAGLCITDNDVVEEAAKQEVIRRYFKGKCDFLNGRMDLEGVQRLEYLMGKLGIKPTDRAPVLPALEKAEKVGKPVMAIQLDGGKIMRGKKGSQLTAVSACVFNAIKVLADIQKKYILISPTVIEPILALKRDVLKEREVQLTLQEALLALTVCATTDPIAQSAVEKLEALRGTEAHVTYMIPKEEENELRKLGINVTCEAVSETGALFS